MSRATLTTDEHQTRPSSAKHYIHDWLQVTPTPAGSRGVARYVTGGLCSLILLNIIVLMLETVQELAATYAMWFWSFEAISVVIFSIEYMLRLWSVTVSPRYSHPLWGRLRFAVSPMLLLDLAAIVPFFLPMLLPDLRFARSLRALRIARALRIGRYSESITAIGRVMSQRRYELIVIVTAVLILMVVSASLMYLVEGEAQPEAFSSIPAALWWAIATLTTVGYGDVYPVTPLGKILGGVIAFMGIGLFALPAGILASGFAAELESRRRKRSHKRCPHCGGNLDTT